MTQAQQLGEQVQKGTGNKRPLILGDRVQHTLTGIHGTVIEVATVGDTQNISIVTAAGKELTKLSRQEFVLDNSTPSVASRSLAYAAAALAQDEMPKLEGPISDASILDELV